MDEGDVILFSEVRKFVTIVSVQCFLKTILDLIVSL